MDKISHKNNWNWGIVEFHVNPPPTPLTKIKNVEKSDKYCVKIKLRRDLTSKNSDPYEFKMTLFDKGDPKDLLLFISNFNINIEALGTILDGAKIQYLCTLLRG